MWQATNLNKRDITLDLTTEKGRDLVRRLIRDADVVVENFSPRVIEQFGLDYESLVELNPDVILVRMRGSGCRGHGAITLAGHSTSKGQRGCRLRPGTPRVRRATCKALPIPIVGVHAGVALLAALEHRRRTGEGQLVEIAQFEVTACVTAEPVIEFSMNGIVRPREGNRSRGYLQGVYPTAVDGALVALSVRDDADWSHLVEAMGQPDLLERSLAHDEFDTVVADWTRTRTATEIVNVLSAQHIPAEQVADARSHVRPTSTRRAGILRAGPAPGDRAAPLSGLAVHDHTWTPAPPQVRAGDTWPAQRGDLARPRLNR